MSQICVDKLTHFQHPPSQEKAAPFRDTRGSVPELECIQRSDSTELLKDSRLLLLENGIWTSGQTSLRELCRESPLNDVLVAFLPAETELVRVGAHVDLSKGFNIPASFWTDLALDASGFFGCEETKDEAGEVRSHSSQSRFLVKQPEEKQPAFPNIGIPYCWHRLGFSVYWSPRCSVILCFDLPGSFKNSLMVALPASNDRVDLADPFSLHGILLWKIVEQYNTSLWAWRNLIRDLEKNRTSEENPRPDYVLMHEMARHAIHSSETLAMAIETLTSIAQEQDIFFDENSTKSLKRRQTGKDLRYIGTLFRSLHLRSKALEERLRNEMNLAFNVVAQHDSRIAVRIADATQVDSASMKTLATLGLVFLPGTFICAVFSTTFFNFTPGSDTESQSWTVSHKFWVYWAVAIPVTGATILFWSIWQRWHASMSLLKRPALGVSQ